MNLNISPKVYVPTLIAVVAGVALKLLTGDDTYLIVTLTGLATGAVGVAAPPAPGVKMKAVVEKRRR